MNDAPAEVEGDSGASSGRKSTAVASGSPDKIVEIDTINMVDMLDTASAAESGAAGHTTTAGQSGAAGQTITAGAAGQLTPTGTRGRAATAGTAIPHHARQPRRKTRAKHYRRRPHRRLTGLVVVFIVAAGLAVGLRLFVVQTFFVPTGSMIPTLQIWDRILVLKVGYTIDRGNIVVFKQPPNDNSDPNHEDLVKRVIGLPGETIWSVGNTVFINGKPLAEPWLPAGTSLGQPIARERIPKGDYFMMGDNRQFSDDSRDWGLLPARLIVGKVLVVIWRHGDPAFHIQ